MTPSHPRLSALLGLGLGLVCASFASLPAAAQFQSDRDVEMARSPEPANPEPSEDPSSLSSPSPDSPSPNPTVQLGLLPFVPPPEEPAPENTLGGGRRNGQCMDTSERSPEATASPEIAALAPPPQIVGLTDRNQPTVWLYQPIASVRHILLSVREEDSQQFHSQTTIDMPPNSQWVPLQLPEDAPPLAPETTYVWAAIALCGNAPSPNDPTTSTRIRRLDSPASPSDTSSPPSIAVAETYARNGQWYDAVDVFVQAQHSTNAGTSELNQTWQAILDYTELGAIAPPLPIPVFEPKPE